MTTCIDGSDFSPDGGRDENKPNVGPTELPHVTVDRSRSNCFGSKPVATMWQGQKTRINLHALDANGSSISLKQSGTPEPVIRVFFEAKDREGTNRNVLRKECEITDAEAGTVQLSIVPADTKFIPGPGIFVANLLVYDEDLDNLFHVTKYWFVVEATLDSAYTQHTHHGPITVAEVRLLLRDQCPEQNLLLDDFEFDDSQILACMRHPIDEFNEKYQPTTTFVMRNFPFRYHWLRATMAMLLEIAAHGYMRDHLPYSAGGVSVDDKNKAAAYLGAAERLHVEWQDFIRNKKLEINIDSGYGRLGSSYRYNYWVP